MKNGSGPFSSAKGLTFQKGLRNVARYLRSCSFGFGVVHVVKLKVNHEFGSQGRSFRNNAPVPGVIQGLPKIFDRQ